MLDLSIFQSPNKINLPDRLNIHTGNLNQFCVTQKPSLFNSIIRSSQAQKREPQKRQSIGKRFLGVWMRNALNSSM